MVSLKTKKLSLGLLGARGHVGKELLHLINNHPYIKIAWLSSRAFAGQKISAILPEWKKTDPQITVAAITPEQITQRETDIIVLALPNGLAAPYVDALTHMQNKVPLIIDLSADYRFAENWQYMIPEIIQQNLTVDLQKISRISNPGCYATAMQLILMPLKDKLANTPSCFGVSGYSGAGTNPSDKNNPQRLKYNFLPYAAVNHLHEKEVSFQLGETIQFTPHVADFFRGINMTVHLQLSSKWNAQKLTEYFSDFYCQATLIKVQKEIPEIRTVQNKCHAIIGGISVKADGKQATIFCVLDNLLKGAASQAIQNINLACGFSELCGLTLKK